MKRAIYFVAFVCAIGVLSTSAAEKEVGVGPKFKGPVGLQLYSLRGAFAKDVSGTLDKVKSFGFKYVELASTYGLPPERFRQMLDERGLIAVSAHFPYERYRDDAEGVAKEAKALGLKYAGVAWIPHNGDFDEKTCHEAAKVFNQAGQTLAKNGIRFFYHTHGYEFQPYANGTLFDELLKETDPATVLMEMDVFWIVHPGQDPVALLTKHGKRFQLMHIKDMRKGTPTGLLTGHSDVNNDVALGAGTMDWPTILKAAKKAGVKYYFIEDESDSSAQQIPQSLGFLEQVTW
ncbi:MAG TPA: sugar phosphate isomerase/epimerase family protein [Verrucomicrobiae bacterium]|jgi:sugar phosphate isomerase/epimerase|nr:sugar phosphate isomerase/epimerase family protein [Verrucomicrobiae bacterium]